VSVKGSKTTFPADTKFSRQVSTVPKIKQNTQVEQEWIKEIEKNWDLNNPTPTFPH